MKYKFINSQKIIKVSPRMQERKSAVIYANEQDEPKIEYKDLVIEEKPTYNSETQELFSWFEDGEVITQKYKVIDKEAPIE
jgi:hypothetical protein